MKPVIYLMHENFVAGKPIWKWSLISQHVQKHHIFVLRMTTNVKSQDQDYKCMESISLITSAIPTEVFMRHSANS